MFLRNSAWRLETPFLGSFQLIVRGLLLRFLSSVHVDQPLLLFGEREIIEPQLFQFVFQEVVQRSSGFLESSF